MEGAIARGAKVVSTEMARAAIAVTSDGRSSGAEERKKLKDRRRRTIIIFFSFFVFGT